MIGNLLNPVVYDLVFVRLALAYGNYQAMLIIGFLSSLVVFVAAVAAKLALKKVGPWWFSAFLATETYFFVAQLVMSFANKVSVPALLFFEPATYSYLLFVLPMAMAYRRIMRGYPMLPWHAVLYVLSLLGSLVFWYFVVFVFGVLTLV